MKSELVFPPMPAMYLAKPNHNNFLHSEKFPTIREAVKFLNSRLMVEPKIDSEGNDVPPAMVFPTMKFVDFAYLGKIMRVDGDETSVFTEDEKVLDAMEELESLLIIEKFLSEEVA